MCKQQKERKASPAVEGPHFMALEQSAPTPWAEVGRGGNRMTNTGLGSPVKPREARKSGGTELSEESLYLGQGSEGMSHWERPSVAGGLISQANRPLAHCSRWASESDLEGPSQSKLALWWEG